MFKRLLQSLVKIYILAFRGLVLDTFQKLSRTTDSEQIPLKCMQLETVWERGMLTCRQISFLFEFPDTSSISHAMLAYVVCYIARVAVLSSSVHLSSFTHLSEKRQQRLLYGLYFDFLQNIEFSHCGTGNDPQDLRKIHLAQSLSHHSSLAVFPFHGHQPPLNNKHSHNHCSYHSPKIALVKPKGCRLEARGENTE